MIKAMYEDVSTKVRMNGRESRAFNFKVGVHQGSVLSPLLFIIVLEALSREFREGLPMELLYADDLVLIAETKELLLEKVGHCLVGEHGLFQSVLLKEVVIEPNVKLECVPKFCYLGTHLVREEVWRRQQEPE